MHDLGELANSEGDVDKLKFTNSKLREELDELRKNNAQLQGQVEAANTLNRQLIEQYGETRGWLRVVKTQLEEAAEHNVTLHRQNLYLKGIARSDFQALLPEDSQITSLLAKEYKTGEQQPASLRKLIEGHLRAEGALAIQGQDVGWLPNDIKSAQNSTKQLQAKLERAAKAHPSMIVPTIKSVQPSFRATGSAPIYPPPEPHGKLSGIHRGGEHVNASFHRFLRQLEAQNSTSNQSTISQPTKTLDPTAGIIQATEEAEKSSAMMTRTAKITLNPQSVPFVPFQSKSLGRMLNAGSESFIPLANMNVAHGPKIPAVNALFKKEWKLDPACVPFSPSGIEKLSGSLLNPQSEPFGPTASKEDDKTWFPSSIPPNKRASTIAMTPAMAKVLPAQDMQNATLPIQPQKSFELSEVPDTPVTVIHEPIGLSQDHQFPLAAKTEASLPPHKRQPQLTTKKAPAQTLKPQVPAHVEAHPEAGASGVTGTLLEVERSQAANSDSLTKEWLDNLEEQHGLLSSPNDQPLASPTEVGSLDDTKDNPQTGMLINIENSPKTGEKKFVPLPPGFAPVKGAGFHGEVADALAKASANTTDNPAKIVFTTAKSKEEQVLPKDKKKMAPAFIAQYMSKVQDFAFKYGSGPDAETEKELATLDKRLGKKQEMDVNGVHEKDEYAPRKIVGTRVIGGVLDASSKLLVLKEKSKSHWVERELDWKPVIKSGKRCYVL